MTCYWGNTSKMRCTEIISAVLNDPTRIDQQYASIFRSFHDARRVTRKPKKRADKLKEDLRLQLKLEVPTGFTGPAKGLLEACQALGINLSLRDNKVILQTPLGATLDLETDHETHFKACISESCIHTILAHLEARTDGKDKPGRADMQGATSWVDLDATNALLKGRKEPNENDDEQQQSNNNLCKPCKLSKPDERRLHTIISGSIRAPHRLKHINDKIDDVCRHPECEGARNTTLHIFWHCARWSDYRKKIIGAIEEHIAKVKKTSSKRYTAMRKLINTPCFQNCGICPGDIEQIAKSYNIDSEDPKLGSLSQQDRFRADEKEATYNWTTVDGIPYTKVYTDGSALNGGSRELARAGWGAYFGDKSAFNFSAKLYGPVQSSYRADLRALLHVVRTATSPVCMMIDCQGVVNMFNDFMSTKVRPERAIRDQDLWDQVFDIM